MSSQESESEQLISLLRAVYPDHSEEEICFVWSQLMQILEDFCGTRPQSLENISIWDSSSVVLITYPDALYKQGVPTLRTLDEFLDLKFKYLSSIVHILPFLQSTSDGGFAVSSYEIIDPRFGDWNDLRSISKKHKLMADLVLNHVSSSHPWVKQFIQSNSPDNCFIFAPKRDNNWTNVVRPRNTSLFTTLSTINGNKDVWTTFGPDQVDIDWHNPKVLIEFLYLIVRYAQSGISWLRLDAIAFIWKKPDTTCLHLKEVHQIVKILSILLKRLQPSGVIITETNVPEKENISYLKDSDEANIAYNFTLPPLLLEAIFAKKADILNDWLSKTHELPTNTAMLNFTASHDGIGLRPLEGIMDSDRIHGLLVNAEKRGGLISHRSINNGQDQPYELNISWWSAMSDGGIETTYLQLERFLLSQLFVLSIKGVPAFYLPALLASSNDIESFKKSGQRRDLNREKFDINKLYLDLEDFNNPATQNLLYLNSAMQIRSDIKAFHPESPMKCLTKNRSDCVIIQRGKDQDKVFALHNMIDSSIDLDLSNLLNSEKDCVYLDCLSNKQYSNRISLTAYKVLWLRIRN